VRIVLHNLSGGQPRELPATPDETPSIAAWSPDSRRIFFVEGKGTRNVLYAMPIDGPPMPVYQPTRGTFGGFGGGVSFDREGKRAGLAYQTPDQPVEAYVLDLTTQTPVRVSAANVNLPKSGIGETRVVRWKGKDGKDVEGLLTLPVNYDKSKRYPLVLNIHGGPAGVFNESFIGNSGPYPLASLAAKGWAILRPNPRGSTSYGGAFRRSNINDWGGGDYNDIMTGVDYAIAQGIADPNKMAVMGWSYGGYMTNWVITQTNRFKCAASGAGLSNLISMWGTNDIPSTLDDYFEGTWYDQPERYIRMSPLYHVKNVTTPTLFIHGEADIRVPPTQAYEMHSAIKRKGVVTEMVVYPRTPHGPQEPKFVLDIMQRHIDWVAKYIGE
jgi:dipeptidyl aminopeptidase/acylaminoacyl peptidase